MVLILFKPKELKKQNLCIENQIKEELYKLYINNEIDEVIINKIKELKNKYND